MICIHNQRAAPEGQQIEPYITLWLVAYGQPPNWAETTLWCVFVEGLATWCAAQNWSLEYGDPAEDKSVAIFAEGFTYMPMGESR